MCGAFWIRKWKTRNKMKIYQDNNIPQKTILTHSHVLQYNVWIPYSSIEINIIDYILICNPLPKGHKNFFIFESCYNGSRKHIVYINVKRGESWRERDELPLTISKQNIYANKVAYCLCMSCWCKIKQLILTKLLPIRVFRNSNLQKVFSIDQLLLYISP